MVAEQDAPPEVTDVLPFQLTAAQAQKEVQVWLRNEGVIPPPPIGEARAAFVPYYVFDLRAKATYAGRRGDKRVEVTEYRGLRNAAGEALEQRGTVTDWSDRAGVVVLPREPLALPAVHSLPNRFVSALPRQDFARLQKLALGLGAGFDVRPVEFGPAAAFAHATEAVTSRLETAARAAIGGDAQDIGTLTPEITGVSFRLALLPVFTGTFAHGGKTFAYAVDGHAGAVAGEAPDTTAKRVLRWLTYGAVAIGLTGAGTLALLLDGYELDEILALALALASMVGTFLLFLWLQTKLSFWLLAPAYVGVCVGLGFLLSWVTDNPGAVALTESILAVMGAILLGAAWAERKPANPRAPTE